MTKVLKVKDKSQWVNIARGTNHIIPFVDNNGNWVISMDVLVDENYLDLAEDILDKCEVIEFEQLTPPDEYVEDTPIKEPKGDFSKIREQRKEQPIESIVEAYYESKKGFFTKVAEFLRLA